MLGFWTVIAVGLVSSLVTGLCLLSLSVLRRRDADAAGPETGPGPRDEDVVFLFSGGMLVDATVAARNQLPVEPAHADDLARFVIAYCQRFEGLSDRLERFGPGDLFEIAEVPDDPDSLRLTAENRAGQVRICITDPQRDTRSEMVAHYSLAAMRAELFTLRSIAERSPIPTWKRRHDGTIIWANSTYMRLAVDLAGEDALIGWPPPDLFAGLLDAPDPDMPPPQRRVSLAPATSQGRTLWFDLIALPGEIETLYFALPIDNLVRAENALTDFVQTLTKTFAHLRIGLAIFDQKRRLALFNPALVDLTGLPAAQLSARPTLHAFLDALRDTQKIPEPKDYKSWRMQIAQLETGARPNLPRQRTPPSGRRGRLPVRGYLVRGVDDAVLPVRDRTEPVCGGQSGHGHRGFRTERSLHPVEPGLRPPVGFIPRPARRHRRRLRALAGRVAARHRLAGALQQRSGHGPAAAMDRAGASA